MKKVTMIILSCILIFFTSCSLGIKLSNNCGKNSQETFIVLPLVNDDFACNFDVENKIKNLCYNVLDGSSVLNDYVRLTNKSIDEIEISEFCDYANNRGINYIVFGTCHIEWFEGHKASTIIREDYSPFRQNSSTNINSESLENKMYLLVTGNYAIIDSYYINTKTKSKHELFRNYKVKKVHIGMPTVPISSALIE